MRFLSASLMVIFDRTDMSYRDLFEKTQKYGWTCLKPTLKGAFFCFENTLG